MHVIWKIQIIVKADVKNIFVTWIVFHQKFVKAEFSLCFYTGRQ